MVGHSFFDQLMQLLKKYTKWIILMILGIFIYGSYTIINNSFIEQRNKNFTNQIIEIYALEDKNKIQEAYNASKNIKTFTKEQEYYVLLIQYNYAKTLNKTHELVNKIKTLEYKSEPSDFGKFSLSAEFLLTCKAIQLLNDKEYQKCIDMWQTNRTQRIPDMILQVSRAIAAARNGDITQSFMILTANQASLRDNTGLFINFIKKFLKNKNLSCK